MKLKSERGAALLAALCFATVLALALGSYMTLCYTTLATSNRNLHSAHSQELVETGMEEALWTLKANSNAGDWSGWSTSGTTATKTINNYAAYSNGVTGSITLTVTNYTNTTGTRNVTVTGTTTQSDGNAVLSSRTATAAAKPATLFVNALSGTTGNVTFSSAGTVDSYDASLGLYTAQTPTYAATVASSATVSTTSPAATVQLVNAQIKGYVASLYSGGPSYSSSAKVVGPTTPVTTKIDTSRISTSPYQPIFTIKTIAGTGTSLDSLLGAGTTTIGSASDTTPRLYRSTGLNLTGSTKVVVAGPVQLVVSGSFYIGLNGGSPSFEIASTGSLEVFVASDIAIYGGGINNLTNNPAKLAIYSNNTLTAPDMNTTTDFYGVIYTPTGDFKVWSTNAIYGAIIARKVVFSGASPVIHYDLNLRDTVFSGIDTPYAISDWRETTNGG